MGLGFVGDGSNYIQIASTNPLKTNKKTLEISMHWPAREVLKSGSLANVSSPVAWAFERWPSAHPRPAANFTIKMNCSNVLQAAPRSYSPEEGSEAHHSGQENMSESI